MVMSSIEECGANGIPMLMVEHKIIQPLLKQFDSSLKVKWIPSAQFSSVTQSCLTLQTHWPQHTRPPCPQTLRVYSNSCPLSQWCHTTISSSVVLFSSCPQSSQHQGLFQWVSSSHQVAKVLEFQLQHQSFQWIFRTDFLQDGLVGSPCSPMDSQESSPTPQCKMNTIHPSNSTLKESTPKQWTIYSHEETEHECSWSS